MLKRGTGILLHITSLPSRYGIGDLGPAAYQFADFLAKTGQRYWQILPLNPTDQACGNSPYSGPSAFAGNPLLVSPELLVRSGFLPEDAIAPPPLFPVERCDYATVVPYKIALLKQAYQGFKTMERERETCDLFCRENEEWLEDFALFAVIKRRFHGEARGQWERGLRDRETNSLKEIKKNIQEEVEREKFFQYLFFTQWFALKDYCNNKGIEWIGDTPIYVSDDSADVWANPEIFKLDEEKRPLFVAGVPPDYFSKTGQLWGNPTFRWDRLQETGYKWWLQRIHHNLRLFDILRIDHFRGFVACWEIPAGEKTAMNGRWMEVPVVEFFTALLQKHPVRSFIAEDLGLITPDVKEVMNRFGFPGMRVLQFAFGVDQPDHPYLPHNFVPNTVVYTGTHDNNTTRGWFENDTTLQERKRIFRYLGKEVSSGRMPVELIRLAMMSIAGTVIIPLQDLLSLGEGARMNRPSTTFGNWEWRLQPDQLTSSHGEMLLEMTDTYGRSM